MADLSRIKGWLDDALAIGGHPLVSLALRAVFHKNAGLGLTEEEIATVKAHIAGYKAMQAEADRRSKLP